MALECHRARRLPAPASRIVCCSNGRPRRPPINARATSKRNSFSARLWIPASCVFAFLRGAGSRGPTRLGSDHSVPRFVGALSARRGPDQSARPRAARGGILTTADRRFLRATARRTWRYFDEFVGPHTSWLPPDNVQETPIREIFLRTSPTNIGLWMLATVAANDFGYITIDDLVTRNLGTFETLEPARAFRRSSSSIGMT